MRRVKRMVGIAAAFSVVGVLAAFLYVYFGVYNIAAITQHTRPVYRLLEYAMVRSVANRTDQIALPDFTQLDWQNEGLRLYRQHCQQCHGSPGVGPEPFSLGLTPSPTALAVIATERDRKHTFWVTKNGIKMSGMPAWKYRLSDREIWNIVAFIDEVPNMTAAEYARLTEQLKSRGNTGTNPNNLAVVGSTDSLNEPELVKQGRVALQQYNCISCHVIPGVTGADNRVGPPLGEMTERKFIAGILENTDENLIRWIRFPQDIDSATLMPNLGVTEEHARQMVAYLYSLTEGDTRVTPTAPLSDRHGTLESLD